VCVFVREREEEREREGEWSFGLSLEGNKPGFCFQLYLDAHCVSLGLTLKPDFRLYNGNITDFYNHIVR
jgi:hypothetical protein